MTWKLDYTAAQAGLKQLHRPDSSRLVLPRFGWRGKTIISFATTILLARGRRLLPLGPSLHLRRAIP
jgi:hypothetical protein